MQKIDAETKKRAASFALYVFSIALAVGIGAWQVGGTSNPVLPLGSGGPGCNYSGYMAIPCYFESSSCTSGEFLSAWRTGSDNRSYRASGYLVEIGNCSGAIGCRGGLTNELTGNGCGG